MNRKTILLAATFLVSTILIFLYSTDINQAIPKIAAATGGILGLNTGYNIATKRKKTAS